MKRPVGVTIIAILLLLSSLQQMSVLSLETQWYSQMFQFMPAWLVGLRYGFSWTQRVVGIACAAGLLYTKEIFRKITIALGVFTLLTLKWKHPVEGFRNAYYYAGEKSAELFRAVVAQNPDITLEQIIQWSVMTMWALEFIFWVCVMFYLTRPNVKTRFQ